MAGGFEGASIHAGGITLSESKGYGHWRLTARRVFSSLAIVAATLTASASLAATTTVSVLLDIDNSVGTGCSVTTSDGPFLGVDKILRTTVQTNSTGYSTQTVAVESCITGSTFSAPNVFNNTPSPIARGNGAGGLSAVETYIPNYLIPAAGKVMRVAVTTDGSAGLVGTDSLLVTSTGQAILVDGPVANVIPTLSIAALALTMLLVGGAVWYARRRGWAGMQLVVVCVVALSLSGSLIAAIVRDGLVVDWTGIAPVATDPSGDAPAGMDIAILYSVAERDAVFFRADVALNAPPVADAQSVVAVAAVALPITLTGSDYEASALTYTLGASPAHGALTGTPPNLTYTATAGYGGPDSFTFKVNDGQLDSTFATVTIDVKLPPTITSANSTVFIPAQANTFTFAATAVPSASFALSACSTPLPPTITVTNNGNNTATLAGNPTVAQGGTYVCTLTATNGFGANAVQTFTLNVGLPPSYTSAAATTFTVGTAGSFTVVTTATPATTSITRTGALPTGVTFAYNGPGTPLTATLSGNPGAGTGGLYPLTFTAANGISPDTTQSFALTVNETPAVNSVASLVCTVGVPCSRTVTATGYPVPTIARTGATLPAGMSYTDNGNGTGTLSGTPSLASGAVNAYAMTFTPSNGVGSPVGQAFTLTVDKANQTLAFSSTAPTAAAVGGATYTVAAAATSALAATITVDAASAAVCTISSSTVSFIGVGTCVLNANQPGNADYNAAPQVQQSFAVVKGSQTIAFTSTTPAGAKVSGPTYTVTATASPSALAVAFTIDASAAAVCSISGATVSFIGAGTCVINANQTGNANYNAAPQVQQSFTVAKGDQTISFTSVAPVAAKVSGPTYSVAATAAPSGLAVAFTIDASATAVCTISGSTVSFIAVGTCVVNANQPGNANYNAAPQAQQSFAVAKGDQTIAFTSAAPAAAKVAAATYTVTATASPAGLPVTFAIDAAAASVCSISGATVSFIGAGTCVINANQVGNANYNAAPQAQQTFAVAKGDQTISFTSTAPSSAKVAGTTYTVAATASSSLTVGFTIDASAAAVCSIAGSTVSFIGVGTCVINANQAGNANYNAAPQVQQSFSVTKNDQTISFTSAAPSSAKVAGATYTVTATASSGLTVTLSIDASASTICTIAGSTVSFTGVGNCIINANQAGNANYNAAPQTQQIFVVTKGDQTITFTSIAPSAAKVGGSSYSVTATASPSALAVAFTIDASATSVCTISGSTVSFIAAGTCVVNANQAGNANYNAAPQVQQTFSVAKGDQTISFTSVAPVAAQLGGPTYIVAATASPSALPVTFAIDASATTVCSISGATVSFIGAGTCVINANQVGNVNYNAAPQVQQSFAVSKASQSITFTSTAPTAAKVGGATYTVAATASSSLTVGFTIDASAAAVCSIAGSTVSFIGVGTCVINANQAGNANYNAAPQVQQSFSVTKNDQTISFTSAAPSSAKVAGATYTVTATASSGLTVTLSIDASASTICTIAGSTVSFTGVGNCIINANQAGNANYNAAPQTQQIFVVTKGDQTISFMSIAPGAAVFGGSNYLVTALAAPSALAVTFTIDPSAASVCTISGSTVSFIGAGTCTINANQAGNTNYNAAPQVQQSFSVAKANQTLIFTSVVPTAATVGGATYTVSANASSGLPATFSVAPSAASVCSISGSTVSFIGNGICRINADQSGNTNYNAAPQIQQSFGVKSAQTITFTSLPPATPTVGGATYTVAATATSGLAVAFTIDLSASSVCSIAGALVTFTGAGTCVINANQSGDVNYYPAAQVQQSFIVRRAQTISFTSAAPLAVYQGPTYGVTATATSTLSVTFTIDPSSSAICSIAGSTVSFTATGNCVINANQAGDPTWYPAPQAQQTVTVGPNLVGDSYNVVGNTQHVVAGHSTPTTPFSTATTGVLGNDTSDAAITVTAATAAATTGGGQITIDAAGKLTYTPPVGVSTGTDTYVYTGTSNGVSRTATITFNFTSIVWYVNSSGASGDGRSISPFTNMGTGANGLGSALSAAGPATGAYIYVFKGTGTTPGAYTLKTNQTIVGEPAGLSLFTLTIPSQVANRPTLTGTLTATSGATGITVAGVNMSTGASNAVDFTNASANFIGGSLAITTTSGTGFKAAGGGTVTVQGTGNTISASAGTALSVSATTIGAAGLNFTSISAGGVSGTSGNGIVLDTTGTSGGLTVTGSGSAGSGGTIQRKTGADGAVSGAGVYLNNTKNVSLSWMQLNDFDNFAIRGVSVNGLSLDRMVINGANGNNATSGIDESAVYLTQSSGNIGISNSTISGGAKHNLNINNTSGTIASLTIAGSTLRDTAATAVHGALIEMAGTSVLTTASVTGSTFQNNTSIGMQVSSGDSANIVNFTASNNTFEGSGPNSQEIAMDFSKAQTSSMTVKVLNNIIRNHNSHGMNFFTGAGAGTTGTYNATIDGNTIGTVGVIDSGSKIGGGIRVNINGDSLAKVKVSNNVIHQVPTGRGIEMVARNGTGMAHFTVTNNVVNAPTATTAIGCGANVLCPQDPIFVGTNSVSIAHNACSAVSGNTAFDPLGVGAGSGFAVALEAKGGSTHQYEGSGPVLTALTSNNPAAATKSASTATGGTYSVVSPGTCQLPPP